MEKFADILLPLPLEAGLTYRLVGPLQEVSIGSRVVVPFQSRQLAGIVVDIHTRVPEFSVKDVSFALDVQPLLNAEQLQLVEHLSQLHRVPRGLILQMLLPSGLIRQSRRTLLPCGPQEDVLGEGQSHAGLNDLGEVERHLYQRLCRAGQLDFVHLLKREPELFPVVQRLVKMGRIRIETVFQAPRAREIREVHYAMGKEPWPARLGPLQAQLKALIDESGSLPASKLRQFNPRLPPVARGLAKRGLLVCEERRVFATANELEAHEQGPVELNAEQQGAFTQILEGMGRGEVKGYLLHGVTGSGKTEVYLQLAQKCLEARKSVLALVPEISLTPQFMARFRSRFGSQVAILHSALGDSARLTEWKNVLEGHARVVVGARSAVFAPLTNLGLIIVDEEHDTSYKQDDGITYDARQVAQWRAKYHGCVWVLGTATPRLETYQKAKCGELSLMTLSQRANKRALPSVEIVSLKESFSRFGEKGLISEPLRTAIEDTLGQGHQALLFLNRRGHSPIVLCPSCAEVLRCRTCNVGLNFHKASQAYICHYCDESMAAFSPCPNCHHAKLVHLGVGTESIEQELKHLFPDARIDRMDRDVTQTKGSHEKILGRLLRRETDILVGTQMVTKGLDAPHVGLVGVLLADQGLHLPDFRAAERTFQLITQVVGRAGRGQIHGRAIVQTFLPQHVAIQTACAQDYLGFFESEMSAREAVGFPPFRHLCLFELSGDVHDPAVLTAAQWITGQVRQLSKSVRQAIDVLGPSPAPLFQIKGRARYFVLLKGLQREPLERFCAWFYDEAKPRMKVWGVGLKMDLDPQHFL